MSVLIKGVGTQNKNGRHISLGKSTTQETRPSPRSGLHPLPFSPFLFSLFLFLFLLFPVGRTTIAKKPCVGGLRPYFSFSGGGGGGEDGAIRVPSGKPDDSDGQTMCYLLGGGKEAYIHNLRRGITAIQTVQCTPCMVCWAYLPTHA